MPKQVSRLLRRETVSGGRRARAGFQPLGGIIIIRIHLIVVVVVVAYKSWDVSNRAVLCSPLQFATS